MSGRRRERPVPLPLGALLDPVPDDVDVGGAQLMPGIGWGHDATRVVMRDPCHQGASVGVAGDDHAEVTEQAVLGVESQVGFAGGGIRAVAFVAGTREDRPDVEIEVHRRCVRLRGGGALDAVRSDHHAAREDRAEAEADAESRDHEGGHATRSLRSERLGTKKESAISRSTPTGPTGSRCVRRPVRRRHRGAGVGCRCGTTSPSMRGRRVGRCGRSGLGRDGRPSP